MGKVQEVLKLSTNAHSSVQSDILKIYIDGEGVEKNEGGPLKGNLSIQERPHLKESFIVSKIGRVFICMS